MPDALGVAKAHIVGLSMGGFATLHSGFRHPGRALSLCVAGCGYGADPQAQDWFRAEADVIAATLMEQGMAAFAERYAARGATHMDMPLTPERVWRALLAA